MTVQEIKKTFGIDISTKSRLTLYNFLRAIYTKEHYKKKEYTFERIGDELNRNHPTIINLYYKYSEYKKDPIFCEVLKMYKSKNKNIANIYKMLYAEKVQESIKLSYQNKVVKDSKYIKPYIPALKTDFDGKKDKFFIVIDVLRFKNTYLNNKIFKDWDYNDWKTYYKIKNEQLTKN